MNEISVIIPVYNGAKTIKRCLDSILASEFNRLSLISGKSNNNDANECDDLFNVYIQIVVVNDGSTDETLDIVKEMAKSNDCITVITQNNQGTAIARQTGLLNAKGDYICWVDADDWVEPQWLESLYLSMIKYNADFIVTECTIDYSNEFMHNDNKLEAVLVADWNKDEAISSFLIHKELNGTLWTKMIKRQSIEDICFHPGRMYYEDETFVFDILLRCRRIVKISSSHYHLCVNNDSLCAKGISEQRIKDTLCFADYIYSKCCSGEMNNHVRLAEQLQIKMYYSVLRSIISSNNDYKQYEVVTCSFLKQRLIKSICAISRIREKIVFILLMFSPKFVKNMYNVFLH